MLANPTDDVVGLVTNLYNSNCTNTPAASQAPNPNPFKNPSMGSNTMNSGGSMYAGANTAAPSSNLFGSPSSAASSNPFARNAAGFQNTNLFGGSATAAVAPNSMNLFGAGAGGNTATTGNSLFGGSSFSNAGNTSAFSGATQSNSLFGGSSASAGPFSQQATNASPFALPQSTNQSTGLFGAQAQSNPVFGGGASFGSQKTGLFGQANASLGSTAPTNTGNIFGQSVQAPAFGAQQQTNLFGNANQNKTQSLFAGQQQQTMQEADNPFAAVAQSSTTNIFGQPQMQQQAQSLPFQSTGSVFGGNQNTNTFSGNANMAQSPFAAAQQNPLINNQPIQAQGQPQTLQQQQQSIFGASSFSAQPIAPVQTPFGGGGNVFQSVQEQQQQPTAQPLFSGQAQQQQNIFGAAVAPAQQLVQQSKTIYTPMDSLSQEELEAFKSNTFDISKIPTNPPPMELCT